MQQPDVQPDDWQVLKAFTDARIALGSTGVSLPLKAVLEARLAHAQTKDAVYSSLDAAALRGALAQYGQGDVHCVHSRAADRHEYLQRPDLGRVLDDASASLLQSLSVAPSDVSIIIADGLSASAVNTHAVPFVQAFIAKAQDYTLSPIVLASLSRVALADDIGSRLKARLTIILIGERPGLSAADSMGAYITYQPQPGTTDERRNCVSNIRTRGLLPAMAAEKAMYIVATALRLGLTGVHLKDHSNLLTDEA